MGCPGDRSVADPAVHEKHLSPEMQDQMRVERPVRWRTNLHPQGLTHAAVIHRDPWRDHGRALAT